MTGLVTAIHVLISVSRFQDVDARVKPGHDGKLVEAGVRQPEHQPHVLHCGAGCALAEIVEPRDQHGLPMCVAGEDVQFELVGVVQRLGLEPSALSSLRCSAASPTPGAARITLRQRRMEIAAPSGLSRQRIEMQRHRHQHALGKLPTDGTKIGRRVSFAYFCSSGICLCSRPSP